MNSVRPQSKQTASFGNTHTMGLSRPFSPGKWIATSLLNVLWFLESHFLQAMTSRQNFRPLSILNGISRPLGVMRITPLRIRPGGSEGSRITTGFDSPRHRAPDTKRNRGRPPNIPPRPAAKILLISQDNDADVVAAALSDGAKGYVHKLDASLGFCLRWNQSCVGSALPVRG
jgi:hypothetical protein